MFIKKIYWRNRLRAFQAVYITDVIRVEKTPNILCVEMAQPAFLILNKFLLSVLFKFPVM